MQGKIRWFDSIVDESNIVYFLLTTDDWLIDDATFGSLLGNLLLSTCLSRQGRPTKCCTLVGTGTTYVLRISDLIGCVLRWSIPHVDSLNQVRMSNDNAKYANARLLAWKEMICIQHYESTQSILPDLQIFKDDVLIVKLSLTLFTIGKRHVVLVPKMMEIPGRVKQGLVHNMMACTEKEDIVWFWRSTCCAHTKILKAW